MTLDRDTLEAAAKVAEAEFKLLSKLSAEATSYEARVDFASAAQGATRVAAAIRALIPEATEGGMPPEGYKLVPIEPTEHMLDIGACFEPKSDRDEGALAEDIYRAMLNAAPST